MNMILTVLICKDTEDNYDPNYFNRHVIHIITKNEYDPNGFDRHGLHRDTKNECDSNVIPMVLIGMV